MGRILLTGITGLVGSSFVVELFKRGNVFDIVALTRSRMNDSAEKRVENVIKEQCKFDGCLELADKILSHIKVIEYDTTLSSSTLPFSELKDIDTVFHCAADVNLGKDINGYTYNCNYGGTQRMLQIANRLGVKEFHYVSTAYVAGRQSGIIKEDPGKDRIEFNNAYEKSKYDSERLVLESGLAYNIYRPSIIVGRLSDGAIRKPLAFYRLCEFLAKIKKRECVRLGKSYNEEVYIPMRLEAKSSKNIYFVPIDYVQKTIVNLFLRDRRNTIYHITGRGPASIKGIEEVTCSILKIKGLTVVDHIKDPYQLERAMQKYIGDLLPYFSSSMIFDISNVVRELGEKDLDWEMNIDTLDKIIRRYYIEHFPEILG